jgi:lysophospholipase L1-like esterase
VPYPGTTISRLAHLFWSKRISLEKFDFIIVHVGTNDVAQGRSVGSILSDYGNLIAAIRSVKRSISIIVSSILPRPVDQKITDGVIFEINTNLRENISKDLSFKFVRSYRPFCFKGKVKRHLFAKLDGGLHLNAEGTSHLRHYLIGVITHL